GRVSAHGRASRKGRRLRILGPQPHMMQHSTGYKSPTTRTTRTVLGFISNLAAVLRTLMPPTKGRKTRAGTSSLTLLLTSQSRELRLSEKCARMDESSYWL